MHSLSFLQLYFQYITYVQFLFLNFTTWQFMLGKIGKNSANSKKIVKIQIPNTINLKSQISMKNVTSNE